MINTNIHKYIHIHIHAYEEVHELGDSGGEEYLGGVAGGKYD